MNTLEVVGFVLVVMGTFLQCDRWPGHTLPGKVENVLGVVTLGIDWASNSQRTHAANLACFGLPSSELAACMERAALGSCGPMVSGIFRNVVLGLAAAALGWVVAKLVPGHGPLPPEDNSSTGPRPGGGQLMN